MLKQIISTYTGDASNPGSIILEFLCFKEKDTIRQNRRLFNFTPKNNRPVFIYERPPQNYGIIQKYAVCKNLETTTNNCASNLLVSSGNCQTQHVGVITCKQVDDVAEKTMKKRRRPKLHNDSSTKTPLPPFLPHLQTIWKCERFLERSRAYSSYTPRSCSISSMVAGRQVESVKQSPTKHVSPAVNILEQPKRVYLQ